jgi:hypothetical protein
LVVERSVVVLVAMATVVVVTVATYVVELVVVVVVEVVVVVVVVVAVNDVVVSVVVVVVMHWVEHWPVQSEQSHPSPGAELCVPLKERNASTPTDHVDLWPRHIMSTTEEGEEANSKARLPISDKAGYCPVI